MAAHAAADSANNATTIALKKTVVGLGAVHPGARLFKQ
jgi:hypothetical protein